MASMNVSNNDPKDITISTLVQLVASKDARIKELEDELKTKQHPRTRVIKFGEMNFVTQHASNNSDEAITLVTDSAMNQAVLKVERGAPEDVLNTCSNEDVSKSKDIKDDPLNQISKGKTEPKERNPWDRENWIAKRLDESLDLKDEIRRRNCLAKVVREFNISIVDNVIEEELLFDLLIQNGCLTDDEYQYTNSRQAGRTNKLRCLVGQMLFKDFKSLLVFVSFLFHNHCFIGKDMDNKFKVINDEDIDDVNGESDGNKAACCVACVLPARINLVLVAGDLLRHEMITDLMYSQISRAQYDNQSAFWEQLLQGEKCKNDPNAMANLIIESLRKAGFQSDIVRLMEIHLSDNVNSFQCCCGPRMQLLKPQLDDANKDSGLEYEQLLEAGMELTGADD